MGTLQGNSKVPEADPEPGPQSSNFFCSQTWVQSLTQSDPQGQGTQRSQKWQQRLSVRNSLNSRLCCRQLKKQPEKKNKNTAYLPELQSSIWWMHPYCQVPSVIIRLSNVKEKLRGHQEKEVLEVHCQSSHSKEKKSTARVQGHYSNARSRLTSHSGIFPDISQMRQKPEGCV